MSSLIFRLKAELCGLKQERSEMLRSNRDGSLTVFIEEINEEIQRINRLIDEHVEAQQVAA